MTGFKLDQDGFPAFMFWTLPRPHTVLDVDLDNFMHQWQDGRCAMCESGNGQTLDHDHQTGLGRGYLCRSCNACEPHRFTPVWMRWRAGFNPARVFDWRIEYPSSAAEIAMRTPADPDVLRRGAEAAGRIG